MELEKLVSANTFGEKFIYIRQKHIPFFNVIISGVTVPNPDYDVSWDNGVPCYIFDCVTRGRCFVDFNGETLSAQSGDLIFLDRHIDARMYSDRAEPCEKIWVQLSGSLMKGLTELYGMRGRAIVRKIDAYPIFGDIRRILAGSDISTANDDMREISSKISELISVFMQEETFGLTDRGNSTAARVRLMLEQSLYHVVSLSDISDELQLSEPHIVRSFKSAYGVTPMKYLAGLRIDSAKLMLSDTILPVSAIAAKLCYSDSRHFATVFRSRAGISPSEYRERCRAKNRKEPPER